MYLDTTLDVIISFSSTRGDSTHIKIAGMNSQSTHTAKFSTLQMAKQHVEDTLAKLGYRIDVAQYSSKFVSGEGYMIQAIRNP